MRAFYRAVCGTTEAPYSDQRLIPQPPRWQWPRLPQGAAQNSCIFRDGTARLRRLSYQTGGMIADPQLMEIRMFTNNTKLLLLTTAVALGLSGAALAAGPGMGDGAGPFAMKLEAMDADKDGKVTEAEIDAFQAARIAAADADGDGLMSASELSAMHLAQMSERAEAMAARMIEEFDADGDGKLSGAEMAARPMPARMFGRIDTDNDGAITQEEVDAAMEKMEGRRGGRGHGHGEGHGHGMFD